MLTEKRDLSFDVLRITAMIIVVSFHFFTVAGWDHTLLTQYHSYYWGFVGTCIFFVLSGCLFAARTDPAHFDPLVFYKRKILTLYPFIMICFAGGYVSNSILEGNWTYGGNPWKIILSLLGSDAYLEFYGIKTYFVTGEWFTAMIIVMYALCPLLLLILHRFFACGTIVISMLFLLESFFRIQPVAPADASVFTALFTFWCGMILGKYYGHLLERPQKTPLLLYSILIIMTALLFPSSGQVLLWRVFLGIASFCILFYVFHLFRFTPRTEKIILFFSRLSFPVYLVHHYVIVQILSRYGRILVCTRKRMILTFFLMWLLILLVSYVIWLFGMKTASVFRSRSQES